MRYTSAEANKLLKKLNEERDSLLKQEQQRITFRAAIEENIEDVKPEYNYKEYEDKLLTLQKKIRDVKHAINMFNISTTVSLPDTDITIDEVLILIPQLTAQKRKLEQMSNKLPKARYNDPYGKNNHIEYDYINYDINEIKKRYEYISQYLSDVQVALDKVNTTVEFEINI